MTPELSSIITLDFVAKRYGMLPSHVMKFGDSVDVRCANLAVMYESYLNNKHKEGWKDTSDHGYSQEELKQMLERADKVGGKDNKKQDYS